MLSVAHHVAANGNKFANVVGVNPLPKGIQTPAPTNEAFSFELTDPINEKLFNKLSARTQQIIKDSVEYKKMAGKP